MKRFYSLFCIVFLVSPAFAQKEIPSFGEISLAELKMTSCPFEPDAAAMKLFDIQETEYQEFTYTGIRLTTERRIRIKIFSEKGYEHATIRIPYLSKKGVAKIKGLKAMIYSLGADEKIVKNRLDDKDVFKEKAIDNVGILNFTFPNLKPGSVIEYSYTRIELNIPQLSPWIIQGEIPVAYSSAVIITPVIAQVQEKVFGQETIEKSFELLKYDKFRRMIYFKENIRSFNAEPFMTSYKDNLIKVNFILFPRGNFFIATQTAPIAIWETVSKNLLRSEVFGGQIKKIIPGTENIIDSAKKIPLIEDRIGFIYESVKKRAPVKPEQSFNIENITEAWENRTANSSEINIILLNLLLKAGINGHPLFVSTREHGLIDKDFPSFSQINGIDVVVIDTAKLYIIDASLKFQSFRDPPLNILNREAFLLIPDSMQWVRIVDKRPLLKKSTNIFAQVEENGNIEGEASTQYYNYARSYALDSTLNEEEGKKKEDQFYDKKTQGLNILSVRRENIETDHEPLFESVTFKYEPQQSGDFYFINSQFLTSINKNPFTAETRNADIDLGCNQEIITIMEIALPSSFMIDHLPKNITVRAPDTSFFYKRVFSSDAGHIYMSEIFEINRSFFSKDEYPGIQDFFKRMYALMAEEIILKKKK